MKLRWLRSASASLRLHTGFIAIENHRAATKVRRRIRTAVLRLLDFPQSGRAGNIPGTRELIVTGLPYLVVYRVSSNTVEILRVLHTSMDRDSGPMR
jgi:addiction module RelE/StbE family toxin